MPSGVFVRTEEHCRMIGEGHKKHKSRSCQCVSCKAKRGEGKSWNKGLTKETDERVRKQSEALTGRTASKEARRMRREHYKPDCQCFMCQQKRGEFKVSDETRKKMGKAKLGNKARLGSSPDYPNGTRGYFGTLSRKIWEEHYGVKIPIDKRTGKSMVIHHKDFNPFNIAWQNLALLSEKIHGKIHREAQLNEERKLGINVLELHN